MTSKMDQSPPDGALMVAFANGDPLAARQLAERLTPRALSLAARMLGDRAAAEDVVQEAMLRLWHKASDWDQTRSKVSTWLYRVVSNLCLDRLRAARPTESAEVIERLPDTSESAETGLQHQARERALRAALAELPERQRLAVVLRYLEGLTLKEAALAMDMSPDAVDSLATRGKRGLAAALQDKKAALGYEER